MDPTHFQNLSKHELGKGSTTSDEPEVNATLEDYRAISIERNLAKFASFVFAPSHTRQDARARAKTWVAADSGNGKKVLARIIVHVVDQRETLNTFDHRTWLALQKLWWETPPLENGLKVLTLRDLARTMRLTWGTKSYYLLKASLLRLRRVPMTWTAAFYDKAKETVATIEEPFTILERLSLYSRHHAALTAAHVLTGALPAATRENLDPNSGLSFFRFNEHIERNLARRFTKPIIFETAISLRGEIALGLYSFLDVVMADKLQWERRTKELFQDDLGVRGTYAWPAERRRLVLRAIAELQGKPISTGILKLAVTKTRDDADYKLVVRKAPFKPSPARRALAVPDYRQSYLVEEILELTGDGHSRAYYAKLVRSLPEETIRALLSETRQAHLESRITSSRARYFTDLAERHLGHKPRGFSS